MTVTIYCLLVPGTGEIRYVGRTSQPLLVRLQQHIAAARAKRTRTYCSNWINSLLAGGKQPQIKAILVCESSWSAHYESAIISLYRNLSCNLTNTTSGGDGVLDPPEEVRRKILTTRLIKKKYRIKNQIIADLSARPRPAITTEFRAAVSAGLKRAYRMGRRPRKLAHQIVLAFMSRKGGHINSRETGRKISEANTKTHCIRGHPLEGANLIWRRNGSRACRQCSKYRKHKWRAMIREARSRQQAVQKWTD